MGKNKTKLQTLKGFRDFLPQEARKRAYVASVIKRTFESSGFEPLETPALEYQSLLLGKYGQQADKLVYTFEDKGKRKVALRYDQTVPTARVLAMYEEKLGLPWKRYQIQPVWRAEKPQKGRYREFLQCDPDIFGTTSPLADAQIIAVSAQVLTNLGFEKFQILVNDRTILFDLMRRVGIPESKQLSIIQTIDKLDKKKEAEVKGELSKKGLSYDTIDNLFQAIAKAAPTDNLKSVIRYVKDIGVEESTLTFRPNLARGLDYYTSTIFELVIEGYEAGSVGGGGRYDKLIGQLSGASIPAVGMAFGFDRLVEAMEQFELFPKQLTAATALVSIFDEKLTGQSIQIALQLRKNGIAADLYPDESAKLDKQLKYANRKNIPYVVIAGPKEVEEDKVVLKDMKTGAQDTLTIEDAMTALRNV